MHADVQIDIDRSPQLVVPAEAIVYAGSRRIVFVDRSGGAAGGRFEPHTVTLGIQAAGFVEVIEGVVAGDLVLATGTFLVAAESRIRSASLWTEPVAHASIKKPQAVSP